MSWTAAPDMKEISVDAPAHSELIHREPFEAERARSTLPLGLRPR